MGRSRRHPCQHYLNFAEATCRFRQVQGVKSGDRAVIVDRLPATAKQPELGDVLEVFEQEETREVISVLLSWVMLFPDVWRQAEGAAIEAS